MYEYPVDKELWGGINNVWDDLNTFLNSVFQGLIWPFESIFLQFHGQIMEIYLINFNFDKFL